MKSPQLEILLFTKSKFASRQLCEIADSDRHINDGEHRILEEACWNGLLWEALPELYLNAGKRSALVLWKIIQADNFFDLEYGNLLQRKEFYSSINPYLFLSPQLQS